MKIKQLFCKHVWKLDKEEYLYTAENRVFGETINQWEEYALHLRCVKCGKTQVKQQARRM